MIVMPPSKLDKDGGRRGGPLGGYNPQKLKVLGNAPAGQEHARTIRRESGNTPMNGDIQKEARVIRTMGKLHAIWLDGRALEAFPGGRLELSSRGLKNRVAVGDRVEVRPQKDGTALIETVLERDCKLSRRITFTGREHVVAANIHETAIMLGPNPQVNTGILDRYLTACHAAGIPAAIVVNKMDLLDRQSVLELLAPYKTLGYPVFLMSAKERRGLSAFRKHISGKWCLLAGHSGVGKTTLVNDLVPDAGLQVGEVSGVSGKGRHTTSSATALHLDEDTVVIDTAGIREFALWGLGWRDVEAAFPEIRRAALGCRFPGCRHDSEPDCAVVAACERGEIAGGRYESFRILAEEAEEFARRDRLNSREGRRPVPGARERPDE
jgi:ribosome biogenesis GTPase / thiamine phosphate phosphatase